MSAVAEQLPTINDKIKCMIDGAMVHSVARHITDNYAAEWSIERYQKEFPDEPLFSPFAMNRAKALKEKQAAEKKQEVVQEETTKAVVAGASQKGVLIGSKLKMDRRPLHEVFELPDSDAVRNSHGHPILTPTFTGHDDVHKLYLPAVDTDYVFNIDLMKKVIMGLILNMPTLLWGYHGTGKTTVISQVAARTGRPTMRVQHTMNMQESDVLGQYTVQDGATVFELGPLPLAMINGWVYIADEYDFAMPAVTALYQPVLEGEALIIKDAPIHLRKIVPHENFRFFATGNTNGIGDETGLYQGTNMQNAANYSRFQITEEVKYMDKKIEQAIVRSKSKVDEKTAEKLVRFAGNIREAFGNQKLSSTMSPREVISAAKLGLAIGADWHGGLRLAFINRLSRVDQKAANDFAQRIFA
ncbi:cobaltochelatase CobS [Ochrobactrum sp. P20RRXII]|nr:MoxR family ATPase [Ochrobactrum sp. P20RRXII]NIH77459.1 cobaltochelatase CobS [Ochrobactrum sp. P20RRXII]